MEDELINEYFLDDDNDKDFDLDDYKNALDSEDSIDFSDDELKNNVSK